MGLLKDITEGAISVPSVNTQQNGLLNKASHLILNEDFFYLNLVKKYSLSGIIVFEVNNRHFFATKSFGFDASSIISSYSTVDFWNGIILSSEKLYRFTKTDNSITPFYQFFSQQFNENVNNLYIYKTTDEKLLILSSEIIISNENQFLSDLKNIDFDFRKNNLKNISSLKNKSVNKYSFFEINFSNAVDNLISNRIKNKFYLKYLYKNALFSELNSRLYLFFENYLIINESEHIYKLIIPTDHFLPNNIELLKNHLYSNISDLFENISFDFEINQLYDIKNIEDFTGIIN